MLEATVMMAKFKLGPVIVEIVIIKTVIKSINVKLVIINKKKKRSYYCIWIHDNNHFHLKRRLVGENVICLWKNIN